MRTAAAVDADDVMWALRSMLNVRAYVHLYTCTPRFITENLKTVKALSSTGDGIFDTNQRHKYIWTRILCALGAARKFTIVMVLLIFFSSLSFTCRQGSQSVFLFSTFFSFYLLCVCVRVLVLSSRSTLMTHEKQPKKNRSKKERRRWTEVNKEN